MEIQGNNGELLDRLMSAASERARVIAENVANQSTPGYQRRVVRFEELLAESLQRGAPDPLAVRPEVRVDTLTPARADGNNVNLELELSAMRQNRLLYELYASIREQRFELLRAGIESGR